MRVVCLLIKAALRGGSESFFFVPIEGTPAYDPSNVVTPTGCAFQEPSSPHHSRRGGARMVERMRLRARFGVGERAPGGMSTRSGLAASSSSSSSTEGAVSSATLGVPPGLALRCSRGFCGGAFGATFNAPNRLGWGSRVAARRCSHARVIFWMCSSASSRPMRRTHAS